MINTCPFCCEAVVYGQCIACGRRLPDPKLEFFATPKSVTRALLQREKFEGVTWEPACGHGPIAEMLPGEVLASDLGDYGYGESGVGFLTTLRSCRNVVTNPPFSLKLEFRKHALKVASRKVALLMPSCSLSCEIEANSPLKVIYAFRMRMCFIGCKSPMMLAWYVWEKGYDGPIRVEKIEPEFPTKRGCRRQKEIMIDAAKKKA
jgi:hypothetical protein